MLPFAPIWPPWPAAPAPSPVRARLWRLASFWLAPSTTSVPITRASASRPPVASASGPLAPPPWRLASPAIAGQSTSCSPIVSPRLVGSHPNVAADPPRSFYGSLTAGVHDHG